ncbi:MAG: DUF2071 domain-containing protein [Fimbriiglobus sp.]|nr:DUF2071 domain-containing protein [Fimbriiglobus sp.]
MPRKFLTADWRNLILANYPLPDDLAATHLPPGVELDRFEGQAFGSLVGFQFLNTKVLGVGWPGFRNFPEWNLRIYVRYQGLRGVCFVREYVPQRFVSWVARAVYNEPYHAARMAMRVIETPELLTASYAVEVGGKAHSLTASGAKPAVRPGPDSLEHFFKEHSWGFGRTHGGKLLRYEVNHPEWDVYPVEAFSADVDWGLLYGPAWAVMNGVPPASVVLAAGSGVSVFPHGTV